MLLAAGRISLPSIAFTLLILALLYLTFEQLESNDKAAIEHERAWNKANAAQNPQNLKSWRGDKTSADRLLGEGDQKKVDLDEYIRDILKWKRPKDKDGYWPQYSAFEGRDYDPNRWEGFPMYVTSIFHLTLHTANGSDCDSEKYFYEEAGSDQFRESRSTFERLYAPYPDYQTEEYSSLFHGKFAPCIGARGALLNESAADALRVYDSMPNRFPEPLIGSNEAMGLHTGLCLDREQRFGPYGINSASDSGFGGQSGDEVEWESVKWGELQDKCVAKNGQRFAPRKRRTGIVMPDIRHAKSLAAASSEEPASSADPTNTRGQERVYHPRTALLLRTWEGYDYSKNDIMTIRAMVTELSLQTGGEYEVFLLVNVKDRSQPIFSNTSAYRKTLERIVPKELREIAILWSEEICEKLYPDVGDWQVYWQQFMPVQWFSEMHPHFDYVWNWEMDVRYTGNHYHLLSQVAYFAEQQPRKYLWERNARYYIPTVHGSSYKHFSNLSNEIIAEAARVGTVRPVWGPQPYSSTQIPLGPEPPSPIGEDNFEWGVGEEADIITLLPIWDPVKTRWTMRNKVWNYVPGVRPQFSNAHPTDDEFQHPGLDKVPRRGYINTVIRLSMRLIAAMHAEQLEGRSMQAEMWPTSVAIQHGFKAVYAPQPIWTSRRWPGRYADAVFNADGGKSGRWGQEVDSIYNQDRETNFKPWSWYYHAEFPKVLYRRWMGWKAEDEMGRLGGQQWEEEGQYGPEGKICLPPMLLHPIKRGNLE
jgi:hypothetical protein